MVSPYYPNQTPWTDKEDWVSPENPGDLVEADHVNQLYAEVNAIGQDVGSHKSDYVLQVPYGVATGSANTYTVTLDPTPTTYVEGMAIAVKINVNNTGTSTININGLGAKTIKKPNGNDVSAGNLKAGSIYSMRYNGANFILQGSDSSGNAIPGDVLAGKTFSNDEDTNLTGTMPNRGAVTITPGTTNKAIAAGYHNGNGYVVGDADLVAANIVSGKNIFGVAGNAILGAAIKSIQTGTFSNLKSPGSVNITVDSVDVSKTIVLTSSHGDAGIYDASAIMSGGLMTTSTNLKLYTNSSVDVSIIVIKYQIIEFDGIINVQSGLFYSTGSSITIASVDLSKSFCHIAPLSAGTHGQILVSGELTTSTRLSLGIGDNDVVKFCVWHVVEIG